MNLNDEQNQIKTKACSDINRVAIQSLSPTENLSEDDEYGVYKEFLKKTFETRDITNIAITGNFGVGKSSVLRTFAKTEEKSFLYLSLLEFRVDSEREKSAGIAPEDLNDNEKNRIYSLQRFECALLRQIISKCHHKDIPLSCFEKVQEKNMVRYKVGISCGIGLYVLMLSALAFKELVSEFFHLFFEEANFHNIYLVLFALVWISSSVFVGGTIYQLLIHTKVKDISATINSCNVEVGATAVMAESCLEQYRFELIYILETLAGKYDAIVFEDMDRLKVNICIDIFSHLREINQIVNERLKDKKIRFLYVVNDKLTAKLNQTKFFDYIMPVIPTLGEANCREILNKVLFNIGITDNYAVQLLTVMEKIPALRDYRTISHLQNEYYVFERMEFKKRQDQMFDMCEKSKLLAFIVYKTLLPDDYYLIREGKGILYESFLTCQVPMDARYQFIIDLQNEGYLLNDCLKYIGYSRREMLRIYHTIFNSDDKWAKKRVIDNDKDYLCVELFEWNKKSDEVCTAYLRGMEDQFMLHFISYPNIVERKEMLNRVIDLMCDEEELFTDAVDKIQQKFCEVDEKVKMMILIYFVKRKYFEFGWLGNLIDERESKEMCFRVLENLDENVRTCIVKNLKSNIARNSDGLGKYPKLYACWKEVS